MLYVGADEPRDDRGLGVAQLGKLGSHVGHRTVVLAQLPAGRDRGRVRSVALGGQRLGALDRIVAGLADRLAATLLERSDLSGRELADRLRPATLGDPPQGGGGD